MSTLDFIFTKKIPQRLYRHIVFWLSLYVFSMLTYFHDFLEKIGFKKWIVLEMVEKFYHIVTQMLFCYIVLYLLLPVFFYRKKYIAFAASCFITSLVIFFLYYLEHIYLFKAIHAYVGLIKYRPPGVIYWFTFISFITYFPVSTGLAIVIKMIKNWYNKQMENERLIRENVSAELQLLKAQVHPHFLFNTLNNIYSFTLDKSPRSTVLIKKLSGTLHYMINDCEAALVPLGKEIEMIKDYMELEKVRYGKRLQMKMEIKGQMENKMIAPLLLIPFIENSFKHGTSQVLEQPWIRLFINVNKGSLLFQLSNSKPSSPVKRPAKSGIGLNNVSKRLELLYPKRFKLNVESNEKVFAITMQIPIEEISVNAASLAGSISITAVQTNLK